MAILVISVSAYFFRLGQCSLQDWDEAIYSEIAKQMVERGEYLTQYFGNEFFFEKPPLAPWSIAVSYKLFSIDEFSSRVPSAIFGVLLSLVLYTIGRIVYTPQIGFIAVVTLLGMYEVVKRGRFATTDMMLTLFIYLAIFGYLKITKEKQWGWFVVGISFGLAFMVKFWAALIIPVTLLIAIVIDGKLKQEIFSKQFWVAAAIAVALIVPWHLVMLGRHGQSFINVYVLRDLIARSTEPLEGHAGDNFHYFRLMQRIFVPWIYILPIAVAIDIRDYLLDRTRSSVLLVLAFVTIALYSLVVATKLQWYILPAYPAFAIFIAVAIEKAYRNYRTVAFSGLVFVTFLAILFSPVRLVGVYALLTLPLAIIAVRFFGEIRIHQVAVLAMYGFLLALSVSIYVMGYHVQPLFSAEQKPVAELARVVSELEPMSDDPIIGVTLDQDYDTNYSVEGPSAIFYSGRPIEVIHDLDELSELIGEDGESEILIAKKYLDSLSEHYEIKVRAAVDPLVYGTITPN